MNIGNAIHQLFFAHSALQGYVAHLPHGAFTVIAAVYIHWSIAVLFGVGFIIFELVQQYNFKDKACIDIAGWLLGMALTGTVYYLWGLLG